jgi:hypothetical protein
MMSARRVSGIAAEPVCSRFADEMQSRTGSPYGSIWNLIQRKYGWQRRWRDSG